MTRQRRREKTRRIKDERKRIKRLLRPVLGWWQEIKTYRDTDARSFIT